MTRNKQGQRQRAKSTRALGFLSYLRARSRYRQSAFWFLFFDINLSVNGANERLALFALLTLLK